jgi:hypothetical protein
MKDQGTILGYKWGIVFIAKCIHLGNWWQLSVPSTSTLARYFTQEQILDFPLVSLVLVIGMQCRYWKVFPGFWAPSHPRGAPITPLVLPVHKHLTTRRPLTRFSSNVTLVNFTNECPAISILCTIEKKITDTVHEDLRRFTRTSPA